MRTPRESHIRFARLSGLLLAALGSATLWPADARAQMAGVSDKPLPNILLLVDTSGSMERMGDGSMPSATSACIPGRPSDPNRWGMLLQALTGNLQPYYSCEALARAGMGSEPFRREYQIGGKDPYDRDYFLPYHRPMTGDPSDQCVVAPGRLPGAADGVGPNRRGNASVPATAFPDDALVTVKRSYLNGAGQQLAFPLPANAACIFDQTNDGQLDAARDYARFALMTFDTSEEPQTGVVGNTWPIGVSSALDTTDPFKGLWSYRRSSGNPLFADPTNDNGVQGHPPNCDFSFFEVGARNEAAPPWEGRLVKFPAPNATTYDVQRVNDEIQRVLLATRPYGATPLDGMLDDARDYYWYAAGGPRDDAYLCRDKFIILLTDGAPNLDMRPACGEVGEGDRCPYPDTAAKIAEKMKTDADAARQVTTFVIGFSVNGSGAFPNDGFPSGLPANNCKAWYDHEGNDAAKMADRCRELGTAIPKGSTADACCKLNEIAWSGSNGETGPFFAESQADIVLSFGQIMARVMKAATTRTLPAFTPTAEFSPASVSSTATSGQFIASFIPNVQRPWSGEIDRTRFQCNAAAPSDPGMSSALPQDASKGDFMSVNLAEQSKAKQRFVLSVLADRIDGGTIDSGATIRPFASGSPASFTGPDGIPRSDGSAPTYSAREVAMRNDNVFDADWSRALDIDDATCKQSRAVKKGAGAGTRGTVTVPALDRDKCTSVVWGFTTAYPDALSFTGTPASAPAYDFNVRCSGGASSTAGTCSVSGTSCTVGGSCPSGEVCVPECAALGAVFRSNPTVVGPPTAFLREEGFRTFQAARRTRRPVMFTATVDGILHAFKAMEEGGAGERNELWSFIPPAVLPKLATNYPAGNQILLDGSPVVRETIWERAPGDTSGADSGKKWHTTLVASLGAGGGGYYALNVTDADCGGSGGGDCLTAGNYETPSPGNRDHVATGGVLDGTAKKGPHFLWQLTDVLKDTSGDPAQVVRKNGRNDDMVALFGKQTGTPAIGTVQVKVGDVERQVGVAILPGGIDGPPVSGGTCPRGGAPSMHDVRAGGAVRASVRQWAKGGCSSPVPGRGVTLVRLDNGEVIRHFGRLGDTPKRLHAKTLVTAFDSPMVGVPVAYPDTVGVPMQKIFIGDADGTVWRIDLTSTNPSDWKAELFQDLYAGHGAAAGQPIEVPPVLSTDETGQVVVNVATGDQENLVKSTDKNFVFSIRETRGGAAGAPSAYVNWFQQLSDPDACADCQARVTGPMVVFDRTLHFATYTPLPPTGATAASCGDPGVARVWGLHYTAEKSAGAMNPTERHCRSSDVDPASGTCTASFTSNEKFGAELIPGVTLRTTAACSSFDAMGDEAGGFGFSAITPQEYHLSFGIAGARGGGSSSNPTADRVSVRRPTPRSSTRIDSWSLVIE